MVRFAIVITACVLAALAPFWSAERPRTANSAMRNASAFPTHFENAPLTELSLTEREQRFFADFPGEVKRFSDGKREIILRFVTAATRKLHPASDCFAAVGYKIKYLPMKIDSNGKRYACFAATRNNERLQVCERIFNANDETESWTDVSAWYWSALNQENGEWWAITVAETAN